MKKVSILDKSTLSRHLTRDPENFQFASNFSEDSFSKDVAAANSASASQPFSQSEPHGPANTFNSHLRARITGSKAAQPTRLGVVPNSFSMPRRHMYSKAADRSVAINERIDRMARKWTSLDSSPCSFEELSHPTRASQVKF